MGRDTDSVSEVFDSELDTGDVDVKSNSHHFSSSLSGSVSNICWVNIKVGSSGQSTFYLFPFLLSFPVN